MSIKVKINKMPHGWEPTPPEPPFEPQWDLFNPSYGIDRCYHCAGDINDSHSTISTDNGRKYYIDEDGQVQYFEGNSCITITYSANATDPTRHKTKVTYGGHIGWTYEDGFVDNAYRTIYIQSRGVSDTTLKDVLGYEEYIKPVVV